VLIFKLIVVNSSALSTFLNPKKPLQQFFTRAHSQHHSPAPFCLRLSLARGETSGRVFVAPREKLSDEIIFSIIV
jgi:hypothetical protein